MAACRDRPKLVSRSGWWLGVPTQRGEVMFLATDQICRNAFYVAADQWTESRLATKFGLFASAEDFFGPFTLPQSDSDVIIMTKSNGWTGRACPGPPADSSRPEGMGQRSDVESFNTRLGTLWTIWLRYGLFLLHQDTFFLATETIGLGGA